MSAGLTVISTRFSWFDFHGLIPANVGDWTAAVLIVMAVASVVATAMDRAPRTWVAVLAGALLATVAGMAADAGAPDTGLWLAGAALASAGAALSLPLARRRGIVAGVVLVGVLPIAVAAALVLVPPAPKHPEITVIR